MRIFSSSGSILRDDVLGLADLGQRDVNTSPGCLDRFDENELVLVRDDHEGSC